MLRKPNSITSDECFRRKLIAVSIAKILCHTFANERQYDTFSYADVSGYLLRHALQLYIL